MEAPIGGAALHELANRCGWRLLCPGDAVPAEFADEVGPILIVHRRGLEARTSDTLQSLRRVVSDRAPIYVLLSDITGEGADDCDAALATQRRLIEAGADDVLCSARSGRGLKLLVDMANNRHRAMQKAIGATRQRIRREVDMRCAAIICEVRKAECTGLFWQFVDRIFRGFPRLDVHIAADVDLGARVGPCTLTEMLGKGSFGRVYGVVNDESGTPEAIKAIDKTCLTEARHASALHREIRMHGRLRHDHIIGMFGALHGPLHVFIRMERAFVSLAKAIKSAGGGLPEDRSRRWFRQLSDAVAHCHDQGVAHRDLKPENIAFDATETNIKVLDFGLCVPATALRCDVAGTLPFMAPEIYVASQDAPYEPTCVDVWACGVILLEMLFGLGSLQA